MLYTGYTDIGLDITDLHTVVSSTFGSSGRSLNSYEVGIDLIMQTEAGGAYHEARVLLYACDLSFLHFFYSVVI